jgi:cellulose biosynthesis protein BcsQ
VAPLPVADGERRHEELSRASLFAGGRSGAAGGRGESAPRLGIVGRLFARQRTIVIPHEIGDLVLGLHPAPLIVVPARKGGVGKTVTAGAVAQVVGYALGDTTGSAAIVDQNIGNPDQWGRLDIPPSAGTVRQLMAALSSGLDLPPTPAWAKTPALAVYPEDRASVDAYPPGLIQRFVQHLRERHVFLVVDLPNRLPDYTTAEAAICAAYLEMADLVILPTTDDPSALLGVLEYLETPSMRGKPVVVSYIVSTDRQVRRHHVVVELLDEIRRRVVAIEMVPKSEKATLAIVKGMSILDISPKLRDAYIRVAHTAVRALAAAG